MPNLQKKMTKMTNYSIIEITVAARGATMVGRRQEHGKKFTELRELIVRMWPS